MATTTKAKLHEDAGEEAVAPAESVEPHRRIGRPRIHTEDLGRINIRVSRDTYALLGQFAAWKRLRSENGAPVSLGQVLLEALESYQEFAQFKEMKRDDTSLSLSYTLDRQARSRR